MPGALQGFATPGDFRPIDGPMWTSQRFSPGMPRGNWDDMISTHTMHEWHVERARIDGSAGISRFRTVFDARVVAFSGEGGVRCLHDRSAARRTARSDLSIIYTAIGNGELEIAGRSVDLSPGMFTITDSAQPMTLDLPSHFRQIYFIFPRSRVLSVFPFAEEFVGVPFDRSQGLLSFFIDHLASIEHHLGTFDDAHANTVLNVTLDLLAMTLSSLDADRMITPRDRQFTRIKSYIEARLGDADLDIATIAADNGINVRYLHKIFAGTGVSVSNWIRKRRLEMCRRDLDAPALARRSVTEIALRWGFNDMSHFSKAFRREFGVGPREYRYRAKL
ncbi:MAG: helix-turn-helix domain-containing protein [Sphingobium sp.]|nr:helix-turn-helix domain-containing protein [Sphingobium sp.]